MNEQSGSDSQTESIINRTRRQEQIAEFVLLHTSARVQELAELFNVSPMTIHRDLDELENQGVIRKVRGGATAQPSSLFESDVRYRRITAINEKEAIARAAMAYVEPGQALILDDSTTTFLLARSLVDIEQLTVITNCLGVINELSPCKNIRLIALGGDYFPRYDAFAGVVCEQAINALRASVLFISTSAVSELTAFHQEQEIVKVKRAMLASAEKRILLIDHNKFGKVALHRLAPLYDFSHIIVDSGIDPATLQNLKSARLHVDVARL